MGWKTECHMITLLSKIVALKLLALRFQVHPRLKERGAWLTAPWIRVNVAFPNWKLKVKSAIFFKRGLNSSKQTAKIVSITTYSQMKSTLMLWWLLCTVLTLLSSRSVKRVQQKPNTKIAHLNYMHPPVKSDWIQLLISINVVPVADSPAEYV